jgi:riboflavin kinase/FMN adenylyltransferase
VELILRADPALRVVVEPFTLQLSKMSPEHFVQTILRKGLDAKMVFVGKNFRFGHQRSGDLSLLGQLGHEFGFEALAQPLVGDASGVFSSTRAREALACGDIETVAAILGRPHALTGRVVHGEKRGRQIGVPTANLDQVQELTPAHGVYACAVDVERESVFVRLGVGALNVGVRPTVQAGPSSEVHLLDLDQDLYGCMLRVHLLGRVRAERRFDSLEQLKRQIERDLVVVRELASEVRGAPEAAPAWF